MSRAGKRKGNREAIYARVIKVCKSDPDLTHMQIMERFGIGRDKALELMGIAKGEGEI